MPAPPDLTGGGTRDKNGDITLGPTGARGWLWGWDHHSTLALQILVTAVERGSPADGVLREGDVILGVGRRPFADDARIAFGRTITEAEKAKNRGVFKLIRWRKGSRQEVRIRLRAMGSYSDTAPFNCRKSRRILDDACRYLAAKGLGDGVAGAVNALGLLATGRKEHLGLVKGHARKVAPPGLKLKLHSGSGMASWDWGYKNLFLTEYHLATGDRSVLGAIREYSTKIARGQSGVGTWGHGMAWPDGNDGALHGRLGGYGALNQAGLICHLSLVLARKCGVREKEVDEAIERARVFFRFYVNKGAIPYGDHQAYMAHDDNGKCSIAAIIFDLLGDREAASFFSRMTVASYSCREEGHTGNYFSFLWGPPGATRRGPEAVGAFMKELHWFYDLERRPDGGFTYQGKPGMNRPGAEHQYGGWDCTGARILTFALPLRKLYITGRGRSVCETLAGGELKETIEAGRDFSWWGRSTLYDHREADELLKGLGSWSPIVRHYSARSLARKPGNFVPKLTAMLGDRDLNARYGACRALASLGGKAAPAVDALVRLLSHRDLWLRIRASCALAGIGAPARKAVPHLLRLALLKAEDDPREMTQRYLSEALFGGRGLLKGSVRDVDRDVLLRVVRKVLKNDDGRAREFVKCVFAELSYEELGPLWPDIVEAVEVGAPSGVMFEAGIRNSALKLLARHKVEEGIEACVRYGRTQNRWASEKRMSEIMGTLKQYGAAAKRVLPDLRELVAYCRIEPDFPEWARKQKTEVVQEAIRAIEAATETPQLRSIAPYLERRAPDLPPDDASSEDATR